MPKIIAFHSFRHGVGRSTIAANIGYLLAIRGQKVGVIDTETTTSSLHYLFGVQDDDFVCSFGDYLAGRCTIQQAVIPLHTRLKTTLSGQMYFVPGSTSGSKSPEDIDSKQYLELMSSACQTLVDAFDLDTLIVDMEPGLDEKALVLLSMTDVLTIVLRHDWRDYQGTGVTIDVVRQLNTPHLSLMINEVPESFGFDEIKAELEKIYNCRVSAVLPHVPEMAALGNQEIFALRHPNHPLTATLKSAAEQLVK